jgi:5-methylcytosine-specific restriction protein A
MANQDWAYLYKRKAWQILRHYQLINYPLCKFCEAQGMPTLATVVDHIRPHKGDLNLFLDPSNVQSLCKLHHDSSKQRMEAGQMLGGGADGMPLDARHHWHK